jgi:serine/threonine protein phosphatase 1
MILFSRRVAPAQPAIARIPDGLRVYAIGDVHGRADLLQMLLERIARDRAGASEVRIVCLGDYIDRGTSTRQVLDLLSGHELPAPVDALMGNHEAMMLACLDGLADWEPWLANGAVETIFSYGIDARAFARSGDFEELRERLLAAMPAAHISFLRSLRMSIEIGDYFFVHAGVRPGIALDRQAAEDLIWIRHDFIDSDLYHGKRIVHGHTPVMEPEVRPNRINIDTGAYLTNRLTCAVLEGDEVRLLQT